MTQSPTISVAISRFEDLVGRGLRALIDEDETLQPVAVDVPHEHLGEVLKQHRPLVAIINFGSLASAAELRELHRHVPATRLVVLSNRPTGAESRQMLAFGATACLAKSTQGRDVLHAIHLASRGLHVIPYGTDAPPEVVGPPLLTPREADVLELLRSGHSNAEIALTLQISLETVRTHARHVFGKLGVGTRRELRP
jgi:DNA-binding NarL/FixJ family response regulator